MDVQKHFSNIAKNDNYFSYFRLQIKDLHILWSFAYSYNKTQDQIYGFRSIKLH